MQSATAPALDHLLRTLAPVATACRILSLGAMETAYAASAALLGFDVAVCDLNEDAVNRLAPLLQPAAGDDLLHLDDPTRLPYPDAAFDWIVASTLLSEAAAQKALPGLLNEARRVLKPGGWIYVVARAARTDAPARNGHPSPYRFTQDFLTETLEAARFDQAQAPRLVEHDGDAYWQAIYRRVDAGTVA